MERHLLIKRGKEEHLPEANLYTGELAYALDTKKAYIGTDDGAKEIEAYGTWLIENNLLGEDVKGFIKKVRELAETDKDKAIELLIEKYERLCIDVESPLIKRMDATRHVF